MREGWSQKKLRDVCELINGRAYSKPELLSEGKYPVLRVGNFFTNNHWYYSDMELHADKYCDDGDLLYAWSASFGPRIWTGGKVIFHYHIWKVRPDTDRIDKNFLYYFFMWDTDQIKADQGAGTTMIHVSKGSMEDRIIYVPPLPEQQRIVALLDEAFDGIATAKANAEKNLKNARELFESHLQSVFTQRAEGWVEKRLDDIIESNIIGLTKSSRDQGPEKAYRYVKMNNITRDNRFDITRYVRVDVSNEELRKFHLKDGDFLFNTRNSYELVGKSCLFENDSDDFVLFNNNIMRIRFNHGVVAQFVLFAFSSSRVAEKLNSLKSGTTNVSAIYHKDLKSVPIPIPSFEVQRNVVADLTALSEETQRLEALYRQKLAALDELKKSLLHKAFNGEL